MDLADEPLGPPRIYMFLGPAGSANEPPPTKACSHCNKEFIPSGPHQVYCSEICYCTASKVDPEFDPGDNY